MTPTASDQANYKVNALKYKMFDIRTKCIQIKKKLQRK